MYNCVGTLVGVSCVDLSHCGTYRAVLRDVEGEAVTLEHWRWVVDIFDFYVDDYLGEAKLFKNMWDIGSSTIVYINLILQYQDKHHLHKIITWRKF